LTPQAAAWWEKGSICPLCSGNFLLQFCLDCTVQISFMSEVCSNLFSSKKKEMQDSRLSLLQGIDHSSEFRQLL
jgi:hypothetical protein